MSSIWAPLEIFGAPPRAWVTSPAPPPAEHTACLPGSVRLHATFAAALGGHSMTLPSPQCCRLLLQLGCAFMNRGPSWPLFGDLSPATQCQASAALRALHTFKTSPTGMTFTPPILALSATSGAQCCVLTPRRLCPDFASAMLVSSSAVISQLQLTSVNCPRRAKVSPQWYWSLVNRGRFSLSWPESCSRCAIALTLFNSQTSFWNVTSQALIVRTSLDTPTDQLTKL